MFGEIVKKVGLFVFDSLVWNLDVENCIVKLDIDN